MAIDRSPIAAEIRATFTVAAPLAAANLAQMAMHVTNAVMVGHLGAVSLAAAGLGAALYATLLMTSQGVLTAVAPLAAHAIGADDHPTLGGVAGAGLIVAALLSAPVILILTAFPVLLAGLGYEPELVEGIGIYLRAISWGAPAFLGFAVLRFLLVAAFRARSIIDRGAAQCGAELGLDLWSLRRAGPGHSRLGLRDGDRAMADVVVFCRLSAAHADQNTGPDRPHRAA